MIQFELVTDRISPQTTWGHEDANRIGRAINYLQSLDPNVRWQYTAETNWAVNDIPTWADMEVYLYRPYLETLNYYSVDAAAVLGDTWAELPFDVYYANTLEKFIEQAIHNINYTDALYTGQAFAGQFMR